MINGREWIDTPLKMISKSINFKKYCKFSNQNLLENSTNNYKTIE